MTAGLSYAVVGLLALTLAAVCYLIFRPRSGDGAEAQERRVQELTAELQATRERERADRDAAQKLSNEQSAEISRYRTLADTLHKKVAQLEQSAQEHQETLQRNADLNARAGSLKASLAEEKARVEKLAEAEAALRTEVRELSAANSSLKRDQENVTRRMAEQRVWVEDQTKAFESRIKNLTDELLKRQSEEAQKQSRKNLDDILSPFNKSLGDFRTQVETFAKDQLREREGLASHIKTLAEVHGRLSSQTEALTKALTTQSKQSGDWGEIQLTRYLESAGFEEGVHYAKQVTVRAAEDGAAQRPDVILYLPEDRQVIIDSKVSIKAWTEANQLDDEAERRSLLKAHVESMRRHISDLSTKDYAASPDISTLDFVVMFVPIEAAYIAAAGEDAHLFQEAFRKGVIVASPTLLLTILKLVTTIWNMHRQEENAEKVIELAGKIHNKLVSFTQSFTDIGAKLASASESYEKSHGQLIDGRGSAMKMLLDMEKRGIKVKKSLPDKMIRSLRDAEEGSSSPALEDESEQTED